MYQFDVNGDGVLGRGEINLWRNHFQIRDELNQDDYRSVSNNNALRPRISWTDNNEMIWLVEHCKRFLLNTFGGLANSNHSIRIFIQNFFIFAYVSDTILTILMAKLSIYRSTHV